MVFREKAKALFKHKARSDSLSKTSSKTSHASHDHPAGVPSNVYGPGETMPRPKYRKPPTKEHKEKLEAFSFAEAWRRKSFQSQHSPMGTRAPSRRNSIFSLKSRRKSHGGRSSRANSITSGGGSEAEKIGPGVLGPREGGRAIAATTGTRLSTEVEAEGDDDVANVGLSRVQSHDRPVPPGYLPPRTADSDTFQAHDHHPFSEQDLALALQRSHLAVPAQS